jgi:hypothetical protein
MFIKFPLNNFHLQASQNFTTTTTTTTTTTINIKVRV